MITQDGITDFLDDLGGIVGVVGSYFPPPGGNQVTPPPVDDHESQGRISTFFSGGTTVNLLGVEVPRTILYILGAYFLLNSKRFLR